MTRNLAYGNSDFNPITPVGLDKRTWEATIDNKTVLINTIGSDDCVADFKIIMTDNWRIRHCSTGDGIGQVCGV